MKEHEPKVGIAITVGEAFRLIRERRRLPLTALARRAHFSDSHLSRLERGERQYNLQTIARIVEALELDQDEMTVLSYAVAHETGLVPISHTARLLDQFVGNDSIALEARRAVEIMVKEAMGMGGNKAGNGGNDQTS